MTFLIFIKLNVLHNGDGSGGVKHKSSDDISIFL